MIFPGKFKILVRVSEWSGQRKTCDRSEWERSPLSTSVTAQTKEVSRGARHLFFLPAVVVNAVDVLYYCLPCNVAVDGSFARHDLLLESLSPCSTMSTKGTSVVTESVRDIQLEAICRCKRPATL